MLTVINASAALTLLEQKPEKIQALSGIRTHDLCDGSAVLSQLSYQSHMRAVVRGLALKMSPYYTWAKQLLLMDKINFKCIVFVSRRCYVWGRFLRGGINYIRYNSYSRDKSAILGITIPGIKMGSRKHYLSLE